MSNNASINYNEALLIESYFKSQSTKKYYLNIMNNHELKSGEYKNMYIRKDHGFAHIAVTYYQKSETSSFRDFEERKYYYVTRIQNGHVLQIRADLIQHWGSTDSSDINILVLNEKYNKVAVIPVKTLISMKHGLGQSENLDFLYTYDIEENSLIWTLVPLCATEVEAKALMAQWQFMGYIKYNKYETRTLVRIISYDINTGLKRNTVDCKSIKQAYDLLASQGFDMSYKTFQRRSKTEEPSLIKTGKHMFYVTDKMDFEGPAKVGE